MMVSKKTSKIMTVLLIVLTILMVATTISGAVDLNPGNIDGNTNTDLAKKVDTTGKELLGVVQVIGVIVAVIMLIVLAVKYISAAPNDKAEIKKHAIVYVVGAVILFGATGILQIVKTWSEGIS